MESIKDIHIGMWLNCDILGLTRRGEVFAVDGESNMVCLWIPEDEIQASFSLEILSFMN